MDPYLGQIQAFGFYFQPRGWSTCQGQLVSIASNTALFSLLGTYYGGNGQTTFGLPDLRGRMPIGQGNSTAGGSYTMGETGGAPTVTLTTSNMPMHTHPTSGGSGTVTIHAYDDEGNAPAPGPGAVLAGSSSNPYINVGGSVSANTTLNPSSATVANLNVNIGIAGGSLPFNIQNPFLVVNYCIAVTGIFPSRD